MFFKNLSRDIISTVLCLAARGTLNISILGVPKTENVGNQIETICRNVPLAGCGSGPIGSYVEGIANASICLNL